MFSQTFFSDFINDDEWMAERRKILRVRSGLTAKDKKVVLTSGKTKLH